MKIEFFHDVICSFCFPLSSRMRRIAIDYPDIEIIHRSFALGWQEEDFIQMFGSRAAVKAEVLTHWQHANQNDDTHRFNISGMKQTDFDFPTSRNGLLAAKAAGLIGGQEAYWKVFDKLQEGLFMRNLNIEDPAIIETLIHETTLPFQQWQQQFQHPDTVTHVEADFALAADYHLQGVPALVINEAYLISGAQSVETITAVLDELLAKERQEMAQLQSLTPDNAACQLKDGQWSCD